MAAACALAMFSGKIIFNSQFWKICGFSRIAFSREGLQRRTAAAALVSYGNIRAVRLPLPGKQLCVLAGNYTAMPKALPLGELSNP